MIFKTRPWIFHNQLPIVDLGLKYLVVSGCSFTYNNNELHASTWPYILKDLAGFQEVLDCSLPGAGNNHICQSLIWALSCDLPPPEQTLVIVMWSGNDRDDCIMSHNNLNEYPMRFYYGEDAVTGLTGGFARTHGNCINGIDILGKIKSNQSRAIENYLYMSQAESWLAHHGYDFVFVDYLDRKKYQPGMDFDIDQYLPIKQKLHKQSMMAPIVDLYSWAKENGGFCEDGFHPNFESNLSWTEKILIPHLQTLNIN